MDSLFVFFLRRSVPADGKPPHAIVCLEYTVIKTLQVLLYSQCHVRRQHSSRCNVMSIADDYRQTYRTAVSCSCFKPDAGMFWNHRKIRTRSILLVKCRNRDSPTSCTSCICRVDFLRPLLLASMDTQHNPHSSICLSFLYLFNCFNLL